MAPAKGEKSRLRRREPGWECLEVRALPAISPVALGGLQFQGDFSQSGSVYSANTSGGEPIKLGLAPAAGEAFVPLLEVGNGSVSFDVDSSKNPSLIFTLSGAVGVIADPAAKQPLWQGLVGASFDGSALLAGGFDAGEGLPAGESLAVAGVNFAFDSIRFRDPDGAGGAAPGVEFEGALSIDGLDGLSIAVEGGNAVVVDASGTNLTGIDGAITRDFTAFGLPIEPTGLSVAYEPNSDSFAFYGSIAVTTADHGLDRAGASLGTEATPGIVVSSGVVTRIDIDLAGEFEVFDLKARPDDDLTFSYTGGSRYAIYGPADLTIDGANGSVSAKLGDEGNPGIIIDSGQIQQVAMSVDGTFGIAGVIFTADDAAIRYDRQGDLYELSGTVTFPELLFAKAELGTAKNPGIVIKDGAYQLNNVTVEFEDIYLGAFMLDDVTLAYTSTSYDVSVKMWFPAGIVVSGTVGFEDGKLNTIGLSYSGPGLPIGDSGFFITGFAAEVQNMAQPADLIVSGGLTLTYGVNKLEIAGLKASVVKVVGTFTADSDELKLGGDIYVGAYTSPDGKSNGLIADGSADLTLDWGTGTYSVDASLGMFDDTFQVDASFTIADDGQDIFFRAQADVDIPNIVPFVGGDTLFGIDFAFEYRANEPNSRSFAAAWVHINLAVTSFDIGFKIDFDKSVSVISNSEVNAIKHGDHPEPSSYKYFASFAVPEGATLGTFSVEWPSAGGKQSIAILPPGQAAPIESGQFSAQNGLGLVPQLDTDRSFTVHAVGSSTDPDVPLPAGEYQLILTSTVKYGSMPTFKGTFGYPLPTIAIGPLPPASASQIVKVPLAAAVDDAFAPQATVSLFVDDDGQGYDGTPVPGATNLPYQPNLTADWDVTGLLPLPYRVYAVIDDGYHQPIYSAYSSTTVTPQPPLSGTLFDPEHDNTALSGFTVYLDVDHDGRYDPNVDPSTITGATGFYAFYGLNLDESYDVAVVIPKGFVLGANWQNPTTVTYAGSPIIADFGIAELATIRGTVYNDLNNNGKFDPGVDTGMQGWQVYLDANGNGQLDAGEVTAFTDKAGGYTFFDVPANSSFTVGVALQANYFLTQPTPAPPGTWSVTTSGDIYEQIEGKDFGVLLYSTISGRLASPEGMPLGGWAVNLMSGGRVVASAVTDQDGGYTFTRLKPGGYTVQQVVPKGWEQFLPIQFDTRQETASRGTSIAVGDLDGDGHLDLATFGPVPEANIFFIYFGNGDGTFSRPTVIPGGLAPPVAKIVALDLYGTGRLDVAMVNRDGVVSILRNDGGRHFSLEAQRFNASIGASRVVDAAAGDFDGDGADELVISYQGDAQGGGATGFALLRGSPHRISKTNLAGAGGLALGDVNNDGKLDVVVNGAANSLNFTVAYGDGAGNFPSLVAQDMAFVNNGGPIALGDINGDGRLDVVLSGIANQEGVSGPVLYYMTQNPGGNFDINLGGVIAATPGGASIPQVALGSLTSAFTPDLIALAGGSKINVFANTNGGFLQANASAIDLGPAAAGAAAFAMADINGDGALDLVVAGPQGIAVMLNATDSAPGIPVTVPVQEDVSGVDFTNRKLSQVSGVVFADRDRDGGRGPDEVGIAGVTVYVDLNGNGGLDPGEPATATGPFGAYSFDGLADGNYQVRVVPPLHRAPRNPASGLHHVVIDGVAAGSHDFGLVEDFVGPRLVEISRSGIRARPTQLQLAFDEDLDPARAEDPRNYRIVAAGPDGRLGTRDDRAVPIRSARYDAESRTVTLIPRFRLGWFRPYLLQVSGRGIVDAAGNPLDGRGTGKPGSDAASVLLGSRTRRVVRPLPGLLGHGPGPAAKIVGAGTGYRRR